MTGQPNIFTVHTGEHNADLSASVKRLREGGQWTKQRVVQIIPTAEKVDARVYTAHMSLIKPPNQAFYPMTIVNAEVGAAYEEASKILLEHKPFNEADYVLFIEHDNIPPPWGLIKLLEHFQKRPDLDGISGLYFTKGVGGVAQIWGDIKDPLVNYRPQVPDKNGGLVETYGIGQGFALWKMDVFRKLKEKKIERPWFKTAKSEKDRGIGTQDLFFANLARTHTGAKMAVACDVPVGHIDFDSGRIW